MIILPVKITEDFSLPRRICVECLEVVLGAYRLRSVSLSSEQFLMSSVVNVKHEVIESPMVLDEPKAVGGRRKRRHSEEKQEEDIGYNAMAYSDHLTIDLFKKDKTPKTSIAWRYFGLLLDQHQQPVNADSHYCSLCLDQGKLTKYRSSSATSTKLFHLNVVHGIGRQEDGTEVTTSVTKEKFTQKARKAAVKVAPETTATVCSFCGKTFTNHHILNKHMKIHSGQSFPCDR
jgi:hypothetical protein